MEVRNIGLTAYSAALQVQQQVHGEVLTEGNDTLILCEHPHVYTFGKSADRNNLIVSPEFLIKIEAEVYETDRGGDITYHGPGQLVGYPIINLRKHGVGVTKYVATLEQSIINALATFEILAYQIEGLTGIWVGQKGSERKIGAIGIRVRNGVSMHGFALNVTTDLSYFQHIVPCGITDKNVTSIHQEIGRGTITEFADAFLNSFKTEWQKALAL
ncbi:MAG TPA: lipoate--protein ligase [Bacteroidetes bacterium]|nr:lipoate--protein ligase [Bacteroidota bacterium]